MDALTAKVEGLEADVREIKVTLRALEPVLAKLSSESSRTREDIAEIKGRMSGFDAQIRQLPTHWTMAGLIFAIFGFSFLLLRFGLPH